MSSPEHPNITTLAVNETSPISRNIIVTRNTIVNVTCDWDEGYPSQTARLTKDGVKLNSDYDVPRNDTRCQSLRRTNYVIQHAQCSDSGLITCEAAGSAHNKSFTLLVRCEKSFENLHLLDVPLFVVIPARLTSYTWVSKGKPTVMWVFKPTVMWVFKQSCGCSNKQ